VGGLVYLIIEVSHYCAGKPNPTLSKSTTNKQITQWVILAEADQMKG